MASTCSWSSWMSRMISLYVSRETICLGSRSKLVAVARRVRCSRQCIHSDSVSCWSQTTNTCISLVNDLIDGGQSALVMSRLCTWMAVLLNIWFVRVLRTHFMMALGTHSVSNSDSTG